MPDPNTALFDATWTYCSMIGKLNFLNQNTHPYISMVMHVCARHVNNPNWTHQDAVKYLCRYLYFTRNHGLISKPTGNNHLNAYVDHDFASQWSHATSQLWDSTISHTSYVIVYCGCPIHWVSKLPSEIALSMTEAKYIALSMSLHDLLPMCTLLSKLTKHYDFRIPSDAFLTQQSKVATCMLQSTVYEDNTGCLELVNHPDQYHLCTKHIGIKWQHFHDAVKNGSVVVEKIDTSMQLADPFTKPLPQPWFDFLQCLLMGW